ncbi:hypothetical protein EGW08_020829, partial [Elysia chlorotica]
MKAKPATRSGSPAMSPSPKSPSKSSTRLPIKMGSKSPSKTVGKPTTNASPTKTTTKTPVKELPSQAKKTAKAPMKDSTKSPAKSKSPTPGAKPTAKQQQKTADKKPVKESPEKSKAGNERQGSQNRGKSPRPDAKASSSKGSQTAKGKIAIKQRETKILNLKAKADSPSKKKPQTVLGNNKKTPLKKTPSKIVQKAKKKKIERELSTSQFIDLWTLANIGKREASLNASMKVNIMYESVAKSPPKSAPTKPSTDAEEVKGKAQQDKSTPKKSTPENKDKTAETDEKKTKRPMLRVCKCKATKGKKLAVSAALKVHKKSVMSSPSKTGQTELRKRKSPHYKIFKEEPIAKSRKVEDKKAKLAVKSKAKTTNGTSKKKKPKAAPSGHQLCNIIEKSPRQASLIAKAMIALEQEEDVVLESTARTKVYDWKELRPHHQNSRRRLVWVSGLAKSITDK